MHANAGLVCGNLAGAFQQSYMSEGAAVTYNLQIDMQSAC